MKRTTYCMLLLVTILATVTTDKLLGQALPELGSNVYQPQLLASDDGDLLLVWKQREGRRSSDLLVSRWHGDSFTEPVRANDIPGSVNSSPIDEMRAALAGGPGKLVALAWTDGQFNIRVAVSKDGGTVFGPSLQLNRDTGRVLQEFPAIAFDSEGGGCTPSGSTRDGRKREPRSRRTFITPGCETAKPQNRISPKNSKAPSAGVVCRRSGSVLTAS